MFPHKLPASTIIYYNPLGKSLDPICFKNRWEQLNPGKKRLDFSTYPYLVWEKLVLKYMNCSMTTPEDKLVAINGLANTYLTLSMANTLPACGDPLGISPGLCTVLKKEMAHHLTGHPSTAPLPVLGINRRSLHLSNRKRRHASDSRENPRHFYLPAYRRRPLGK
jgi:hypothetical protein